MSRRNPLSAVKAGVGIVLVATVLVGVIVTLPQSLTAQSTVGSEDIRVRDRLIAAQESLLNVYRCRFGIDTQVVPGGCINGRPAQDQPEPEPFTGFAAQQDLDTRDRLIVAQESLLNVYRCRFGIDTQVVPGGCINGDPAVNRQAGSSADTGVAANGVGLLEEIYVDYQRPTPPSGAFEGLNSRSLETSIYYPAATEALPTDPVRDAQPATAGGPYPLVLFGHGYASHPDGYRKFLSAIAAGGYVVAAPAFPINSGSGPANPDPRDTANQPGDLSFLIDAIGERASDPQWPLFELVDLSRIAATGHSNGAVTTLGMSANSCCRDERVDSAVAMAGPAAHFDGEYDFTNTPPILFIHGTEDAAIVYAASAQLFNQVTAAKGLLTLKGGDHSSWLRPGHEFFEDVTTTILDFLDATLNKDANAAGRLALPRSSPNVELAFAPEAKSGVTVEVETVEAARRAWVEPSTGLVDGQTVTVSWSGYLPGQTVNIVQCSQGALRDAAACDFTRARILYPNSAGYGSVEMVIIAGPIGTGVCDATVDDCVIAVNDSGILEPEATIRIPLSFAP